ncbi:transcription factor MYB1R1-like, partial [Asparagus officinalis]|uniref:transcription factor MYB1R1-like n=1 Tax=Asparagus officinalis TaxID=4686 RepID=UPI00098E6F46
GYASEDFGRGSSSSCCERKRGVPWTEEEHRMFLLGLQKLGKGDWRGISRNFVISRTPTQVASHAQKYFIRQTNTNRRKRRSSLFDIVPDEAAESQFFPVNDQESDNHDNAPLPPPNMDEECESMDSNNSIDGEATIQNPEPSQCTYTTQETLQCIYPVMYPTFLTPVLPYPLPLWTCSTADTAEKRTHEVLKPTPVLSRAPINVDELLGMSNLSIGEQIVDKPSPLVKNSIRDSGRQSAFHAKPPSSGSTVKSRVRREISIRGP